MKKIQLWGFVRLYPFLVYHENTVFVKIVKTC
jgi:hypothetical protein